MTLLDIVRKDYRVASALHEAGHAVAYLSIGREFEYLSAVDGQLVGNGKTVDAWDRKSLSGPAVEPTIYHYGCGGDGEIYERIVDEIRQRELAEGKTLRRNG